MARLSPRTIERRLAAAQLRFPLGQRVLYRPVMGRDAQVASVIRSHPWALGCGEIVLKIEARTGGVSVDHLTLIEEPIS